MNGLKEDQNLGDERFSKQAVVELELDQAEFGQVFWIALQDACTLLLVVVEGLRVESLQKDFNHAQHVLQVRLDIALHCLVLGGLVLRIHVHVVSAILVGIVSLGNFLFKVEAVRAEDLRGESVGWGVFLLKMGCSGRFECSKNCGSSCTHPHSSG